MNDVHCQCMIEGQVGELGVGGITPAARWKLMFGMRSCGLPALEIKGKNEGSDARRSRLSVECSEKSEEFLKGSGNQSVRTEIEKGSQKSQSSERSDARKSHTSRQIYSFFIKRENLLTHTCKRQE